MKVNNRKILNGILEAIGIGSGAEHDAQRLGVLRAIDKLDRLGTDGVTQLLGAGRKDESGDFTRGAGLSPNAIARVIAFTQVAGAARTDICNELAHLVGDSVQGREGVAELREIDVLLGGNGYTDARIAFDAGDESVRGLRRLGFAATMRPFEGVGHTVSPAMRAVLFGELRRALGTACGG